MYFIPLIFVFLLILNPLAAQPSEVWKILEDVEIKTKYDAGQQYEVDYPVFGQKLKELQGKTITIKGYIIPLEELKNQNYFILSAFPYNLCYFCGAAGPETIMEVTMQGKIPYTSEPIVIEGTLQLNDSDYNHLMYILTNAKIIE